MPGLQNHQVLRTAESNAALRLGKEQMLQSICILLIIASLLIKSNVPCLVITHKFQAAEESRPTSPLALP